MKSPNILGLLKNGNKPANAYHDAYEEATGKKFDLKTFLAVRAMENRLIELGHITKEDLHPVPPYLEDKWSKYADDPTLSTITS